MQKAKSGYKTRKKTNINKMVVTPRPRGDRDKNVKDSKKTQDGR